MNRSAGKIGLAVACLLVSIPGRGQASGSGAAAPPAATVASVPAGGPLSGSRNTPPPGSLDPLTSGAIDSTAWIPRLPEDSLEVGLPAVEGSSEAASAGPARLVAPSGAPETGRLPFDPGPFRQAADPLAGGVYAGYPGWAGAMIVAPADGPAAFRSGIAGLPGVGILWTPGIELRLGQPAGLFSTNGLFLFGNLFLGRTWLEQDRDYTGLESGLGYRWILSDRRGLRWIAAVEAGGYWRSESAWPYRPCLRAYWLLVD